MVRYKNHRIAHFVYIFFHDFKILPIPTPFLPVGLGHVGGPLCVVEAVHPGQLVALHRVHHEHVPLLLTCVRHF